MFSFFDCNVAIGKIKTPMPGGILDTARLLSEMDRYRIDESLFYHIFAKRNAPSRGNALAVQAAAQSSRLHPCWVLLPTCTGELPPLNVLAAQMEQAVVRAVRLAPDAGAHMYSLAPVVCGDLFEWMSAHRLPLFIEFTAITWDDIDGLCGRYPGLPLVLLDVTYRIGRNLYPRLKAYPNLYVETSGLEQHCGIQEICEQYGAERLLFGSRLPYFCAGAAIQAVEKAGISDGDKELIAGGNVRRLLANVILG